MQEVGAIGIESPGIIGRIALPPGMWIVDNIRKVKEAQADQNADSQQEPGRFAKYAGQPFDGLKKIQICESENF